MRSRLVALLSLYHKYVALFPASNTVGSKEEARRERLAWASQNIGRTVSSWRHRR